MVARVVVRLRPGSDGDATHVPKAGTFTRVDPPNLYREKLADQWMQARGEARPGIKYILERLPTGYTMWSRPRPGDTATADKYLFGHPQGRKFDSPNRFYPHFEYLMEHGGDSFGCPCTVCAGSSGVLPSSRSDSGRVHSTSSASSQRSISRVSQVSTPIPLPQRTQALETSVTGILAQQKPGKGRPKKISAGLDSGRVDEEGTPDVYRNLVDKLQRYNTVDEAIEEPLSPDWQAEQKLTPPLLVKLKEQEQWIPRSGEIVLYVRELPRGVDLVLRKITNDIQLYSTDESKFLGPPPWEAGLVGEIPVDTPTMTSLQTETETKNNDKNIIYTGVRVQPLADPNSTDDALSKRHKYILLNQTRPFVLWKQLLNQISEEHWHSTITNALTIMSTLSLMSKYRFRGTWPEAYIYCHGIYLGSELLAIGDTVRLLPNPKSGQVTCTDVLVIKTIRLKWSNLDKASTNDYDEGRPYNSEVWIYGSAYTSDVSRSDKQWLSEDNTDTPKAAHGYGSWYPLHPATKELAVPHPRLAGRLYERETMAFWLGSKSNDTITMDYGREGIMEARRVSRQRDQRIAQNFGATWYWGDTRADALNVKTINGLEVSKYDQDRNIRDWRKNMTAMEKNQAEGVPHAETQRAPPTTLVSRSLRQFMAPGTTTPLDTDDRATPSGQGTSRPSGSKRSKVIDLSDDENEEVIRQNTIFVETDDESKRKKRAKVMVVIE